MNSDKAWEDAMSRDFDARVRGLHEAPLELSDVKGRAGSIRRRRRAAVAGGVLAAAAVIVPTAVYVDLPGTGDAGIPPAEEPTEDTTVVDPNLAQEPTYLAGDTWHRPDGREVELAWEHYFDAMIWDDRLVALRMAEGDWATADVYDADGSLVESFDTYAGVVVNDAGTTLAWVNEEGDIVTRSAEGEYVIDADGPSELLAVTGGPNCDPAADGCVVYADALAHHSDGTTTEVPGQGRNGVNDAADAGFTKTEEFPDDFSSCGGFYDASGTRQWGTCAYSLLDIAPGGRFVAGTDAYLDGYGRSFLAILDPSDGTEVARYEADADGHDRAIPEWGWTDGSHLLLDVYDYDEQAFHLLLLGADGTVTEVTDPVPGQDMDNPFVPIGR